MVALELIERETGEVVGTEYNASYVKAHTALVLRATGAKDAPTLEQIRVFRAKYLIKRI